MSLRVVGVPNGRGCPELPGLWPGRRPLACVSERGAGRHPVAEGRWGPGCLAESSVLPQPPHPLGGFQPWGSGAAGAESWTGSPPCPFSSRPEGRAAKSLEGPVWGQCGVSVRGMLLPHPLLPSGVVSPSPRFWMARRHGGTTASWGGFGSGILSPVGAVPTPSPVPGPGPRRYRRGPLGPRT